MFCTPHRKFEIRISKSETNSKFKLQILKTKNTSDILDSRLRGNDKWWGKPHPTKTSGAENRTLHDFIDNHVAGEYSVGN